MQTIPLTHLSMSPASINYRQAPFEKVFALNICVAISFRPCFFCAQGADSLILRFLSFFILIMRRVWQKRIGAIITERTKISEEDAGALFREAQTKDAAYAISSGIIHEIRDVQIPVGGPVISLVFQRQGIGSV